MKSTDQIMEWLQKQTWYESLLDNMEMFRQDHSRDLERVVRRWRFSSDGIIQHAFVWRHTPEGHVYWSRRNEELKKFMGEIE